MKGFSGTWENWLIRETFSQMFLTKHDRQFDVFWAYPLTSWQFHCDLRMSVGQCQKWTQGAGGEQGKKGAFGPKNATSVTVSHLVII